VTICSVGALTNLAELWRRHPDLVRAKVRRLIVMGGEYPQSLEPRTNIATHIEPARIVADQWPTEIVWHGFEVGKALITGARLKQTSRDNPVRRAYELRPQGGRFAIDGGKPSDNAVTVPTHGREARYVRVTATRLFAKKTPGTPGACVLALAELQVYSGGRNVAVGTDVQSLDSFHFEPRPLWEREFLVDGYSSQNQLIELPDWLAGLDRRRQLEASRKSLTLRRETAVQNTLTGATVFSGAVVVLVIIGATVVFRRGSRQRRRDLLQLRAQIARDLHDDIGSSIGSIRLLSELAQDATSLPEEAKKDLVEIHQIARETTDAIRDIVWLINSDSQPHGELISRMQHVCETMLGGLDITFQVEGKSARPVVEVPVYRNILFAFKEVLNNVVRHSGAERVVIEVEQAKETFQFSVGDDGCGFDTEQVATGNGLRNLHRRAETLGGNVDVDSAIGRGTTIRFRAKLT